MCLILKKLVKLRKPRTVYVVRDTFNRTNTIFSHFQTYHEWKLGVEQREDENTMPCIINTHWVPGHIMTKGYFHTFGSLKQAILWHTEHSWDSYCSIYKAIGDGYMCTGTINGMGIHFDNKPGYAFTRLTLIERVL